MINRSELLDKGTDRSRKVKTHVLLSLIYRGVNLLLGLIMLPLVLSYVNNEEYGIWVTLFSIITLFQFIDVGLDGGFRNKFAISLAKKNNEDAKYYVSTTYAATCIIATFVFIALFTANFYINWVEVLNTSDIYGNNLKILFLFVLGSFLLTLMLKTVITMLVADQKPSIPNLTSLIQKILQVISVWLLIILTKGSLLKLGITFSIIPVVVLLFFNIYYFSTLYESYRPRFKYIKISYLKDIMNLGIKFFIIKIAVVVLFATDNIIITQLFGPEDVTTYQVANKYFGMGLMLFLIPTQAIWSAVTEAYHKDDFKWIKKAVNKMIKLWLILFIVILVMLLTYPFIFKLWLNGKVIVPYSLSIGWASFVLLQSFNAIFVNVINGIGKVKIQLFTAINTMIINIPLSIFFAKTLNLGVAGIIYATSVSIIISIVLRLVQYRKLMNGTATGVWNE
ncbi:MAG: MATE family efflux transporter [Candidatus Delongbacteria bacterium]|jgi:O-antigen/teichoic acid export membrane protein|nr:MATE family efflux transporter [Candidatus Delongbacteria bacterium]